jgi:hypothetical protein
MSSAFRTATHDNSPHTSPKLLLKREKNFPLDVNWNLSFERSEEGKANE